MKFLVIGLGSMGKRRIRCLRALNVPERNIHGLDLRADRRNESGERYGIKTFENLEKTDPGSYDAFIISTPPDAHTGYCRLATDINKPAFIEASVLLGEVISVNEYNRSKGVFLAPSCTMRFHPVIREIKGIVRSGTYGKITNFSYHSGSYLPEWHPWDEISEFYAFRRMTGGGREIVPFELEWLVDVMGYPPEIKGYFQKTIDLGAPIEDSYSFVMKYPDRTGAVIVDVASRYCIRNLVINMEKGQLQWRWDDGYFRVFEAEGNRWITYSQPDNIPEPGYNKNIVEKMYVDELQSFIDGINNPDLFPYSIEEDIRILSLLKKIEDSDGGFTNF
jgi:predicted dehydrogenase